MKYNRKERAFLCLAVLSLLAFTAWLLAWAWTEAARVASPEQIGRGIGLCWFFTCCLIIAVYMRKR